MSIHLHTTISRKTDEMLEELAKTYGTKSRVIEQSVETLLRVEKVGSCDDCLVKTKAREQTNLREALDLMSVSRQTIDGLLAVAVGDKSIQDFINEQRAEARNTVEILKGSVAWKKPSNFKEFMMVLEEIKNLTRLIEIASYNEIDNTVILRPRVFKKLPDIVAFQMATILEGLQVPFDTRLMGEDIVVKMVRQELYPMKKKEYGESFSEQIEKRLSNYTPGIFRNTLMLVGPAFMNWAEKHLEEPISDFGSFLEDIRIFLGSTELPKEPKEFVKSLLSAFINMNWFKQAKILREVDDRTLDISFQSTTPSVAKLSIVMLSVVLATRGWKLVKFSSEQTTGNILIQFVGPEDQSLLDQIIEVSLYQTIGKQFLDFIPIPREVFTSFASKVYEINKEKFNEIYRNMGVRVSNAIRIMARNDAEKTKKFAQAFILKNMNTIQQDAEIRLVDDEHFTIIFKKIDLLVMNSQRTLIESMFRELNYEISTTTFQNLLSFKLKRLEKPFLEPVPRRKLVQSLIDEMSANSCEEAFTIIKEPIDEMFPEDYPWTIREVGDRILEMYRELEIEVEIEYFEGGFTLKYRTCPYYKLVQTGQKKWLCNLRKKVLDYVISRVSHGKRARIKIIKSLLKNEHPCEYAIFLTGFLEEA
jgi:antitoxin component of RelBE/YafQ-DinJ toxin-antitoxin module